MNITALSFGLVGSYLLGATPVGFLIVKCFYHKDIREFGSGNPGATNVWRSFGKGPGIITLLLDAVKGFVPVWAAQRIFPTHEWVAILFGMVSIVGHNWSVFLRGGGGKGVATSAGVFLALIPKQFGIAISVFVIALLISKHVSVGSMLAAITLMIATFFIETSRLIQVVVLLAGTMILIKHIPNMKRLKAGTESKIKLR